MYWTSKWSSSGRLVQAHPTINQTAYMDALKKYHKTAYTSFLEDENLDVWNMLKTL
jgi:hypothetical protein